MLVAESGLDSPVPVTLLKARRADLERVVNEIEFEIRTLCEKQRRVLLLAQALGDLIAEETA